MLSFQEHLEKELRFLQELEIELQIRIQNAPKGTLHIAHSNGRTQFYKYSEEGQRKYIRKKQHELVEKLAQKNYDYHLLPEIRKKIQNLEKVQCDYETSIDHYFHSLPVERQNLVNPLIMDDETYIKNWYDSHPPSQNTFPIANPIYTNRNEIVRSKSEKMIADLLDRFNIPYVYEPQINMKRGYYCIPDFIILNVRLRKEFILEHLGMMGDIEYAANAVNKISYYNQNGYILGKNLLISMEGKDAPLDLRVVEEMIKTFFL